MIIYEKRKGVDVVENVVMKVLLVEDDEKECKVYKEIIENKNNISLIASTNSSSDAIKYVRNHKPDGVILDLELNKGEGSGFEFIQNIQKLNLDKMPKIVVTTNILSDSVYNFLHKNKVDFIFYKNQANFSQENVLNTLLLINEFEPASEVYCSKLDVEEEFHNKLCDLVNKELDLIGVGTHLKGRKYLFDAICYVVESGDSSENVSVVQFLVGKYKRSNSTISRAMQNAILHAWRISSLEDLSALYTARINYETGVPTPTEFIYFYVEKVKRGL